MNYRVRAVRVKQHDERNRIERVCGTRTTERPLPMDRTTGSFRETIGHESSRTDTSDWDWFPDQYPSSFFAYYCDEYHIPLWGFGDDRLCARVYMYSLPNTRPLLTQIEDLLPSNGNCTGRPRVVVV